MALRYVCSDDTFFITEKDANEHEESIKLNDPLYKFISSTGVFNIEFEPDYREEVYKWILGNWKYLQTIMSNRKGN